MALGDGIRRNLALVDPSERRMLRDAILEMHRRFFPGRRNDPLPGGVSWWFKQDEIHQATHVHRGPAFLPWHREITNYFEGLIRVIDPRLSLHYWDWTGDAGFLFTPEFMGNARGDAGEPWLSARFYVPNADPYRGEAFETAHNNPVDPPRTLTRQYNGGRFSPQNDLAVTTASTYRQMWQALETMHNTAHGFIGGTLDDPHASFRDPIVFLLHSNVDRLMSRWQTDPAHPERLNPATLYQGLAGPELQELNGPVEPWSTGVGSFHSIRPWAAPESQGVPHNCMAPSIVVPPRYDTNHAYMDWSGHFAAAPTSDVAFYLDNGMWQIASLSGGSMALTNAGDTSGFGNLADGAHLSWTGDFTGSGQTEILFNYVGDGNWWLGTMAAGQLQWAFVGNTKGFGNLADGAHPSWVGDFTGSGQTEVLFNYVGDGNWWLGSMSGGQLRWSFVGNTKGFGNLADGAHPSWTGDFAGTGRAQVLFNYVGDGNWWLGSMTGGTLQFGFVGNTKGFGNLADGAHPSWVGDFTGAGRSEVLFNYVGDGNWWLGSMNGATLQFGFAGNTKGFGNLADGAHPARTGDFDGVGRIQVLFNYVGDGNWWLGTVTNGQIGFAFIGNTKGFGNLADGDHPSWTGDFSGSGRAEVLFHYVGDGNWWLGKVAANSLTFAFAGTTARRISLLHPHY